MTSYQKTVWDKLPQQFTRAKLFAVASDLNINLSSAASYIHSWTKRNMLEKLSRSLYKKTVDEFIEGKSTPYQYQYRPAKATQAMQTEESPTVAVPSSQIVNNATTRVSEEPDAVLTPMFALESATDDELLKELVKRGFSWGSMQKVVITTIPFDAYNVI